MLAAVVVSAADDVLSPSADTSSIAGLIANDGGDGISLREAITAANNTTGEDTITFDGSVFIGGNNSLIRLVQGELEITDSLIIDGTSAAELVITGDSNDDDVTVAGTNITDVAATREADRLLIFSNTRGLNFSAATGDLSLSGVTLTGGNDSGIFFGSVGTLTLTDSTLRGNFAGQGGGVNTQSGSVTLINSTISNNVSSRSGGGIATYTGNVTLVNSTISDNTSGGRGGGIASLTGGYGGRVTLTDSTIQGNTSRGNGGGISTSDGNVILTRSTVSGNTSDLNGGGVFTAEGSSTFIDSTVSGNSSGRDGGGVLTAFNTVTLVGSTVSGNTSQSNGGGIGTGSSFDVILTDSTVSGNTSVSDGGGIHTSSGNISLNNSAVSGNSTSGEESVGGGIFNRLGNVSLTNSVVSDNSTSGADSGGGGIYNRSGDVSLANSTISGNTTLGEGSDGGGIYNLYGDVSLTNSTVSGNMTSGTYSVGGGIRTLAGGAMYLANSTVSGNSAAGSYGYGGGIFTGSTTILIENSTITGNSVREVMGYGFGGGGILWFAGDSSLTLRNSIVAGNSDNDILDQLSFLGTNELIVENSLIGNTSGSGITSSTGTGNVLDQSARLAALADNGGPTKTHRLLRGSPAINAGSDTLSAGLLTDQRGENRTAFGAIDMGAYELQTLDIGPRVISSVRDQGGALARPDLLDTFVVMFDQDVSINSGDLVIINDTLGSIVDTSGVVFSYDSSTLTATWDFSSLVLDASFYTFELTDTITGMRGGLALDGDSDGTFGGNYTEEVYVAIPGDANLDGDVEVNEINIFQGTNTGDGATVLSNLDRAGTFTWSQGDFNGDGDVDANQLNLFTGEQNGDYAIFLANLGRDVRPSPSQPVTSQPVFSEPITIAPVTALKFCSGAGES